MVSRAIFRKPSAIATMIGVIASVRSASPTSRWNSSAVTKTSNSTWLSRFITSVTTVAKSSVSEVIRLTTLPDGVSS